MKRLQGIAVVVGVGLTVATLPAIGQAYAVGPSGTIAQEKPDSVLRFPPKDQATTAQFATLFEKMRIRDQVQQIRNLIPTMVEGQIREQARALNSQAGSSLTADQRARLEELSHKYVEKAMNMYPVDEMIADMTPIYQKYLTREDVDGMIAFYSSLAGQHLLDAQPKIAKEYMPMVMQRVQERTRTLIVQMMKEAAEITQAPKSSAPQK